MRRLALVSILIALLAPAAQPDEAKLPWPDGRSTQQIKGRKVVLHLPQGVAKMKGASLVVILHGAGGTAEGMAGALREWPASGYVVAAPKATGATWAADDIVRVLEIARELKQKLPIDPRKVHVVGFSNGGWNLTPLAIDDELRPRSATWVAAGYTGGGKLPKWTKDELGVIAMAGTLDANLRSARATVRALYGDVRNVEVREQPDLGHKWPEKLMPYLRWWMGVMEGRFTPGDDMSFDWGSSVEDAVGALANQKKGGVLVYVYDPKADAASEEARTLQTHVFHDVNVRHYGKQLQAVKLTREEAGPWLTAMKLKLKASPAVVVLKKDGKLKKLLQGKVRAKKLASALRSVCPDKSPAID